MAAVSKYPNRNIALRQGERIFKRHHGEPELAPPGAPQSEKVERAPDPASALALLSEIRAL
jgi:hypothetical protein